MNFSHVFKDLRGSWLQRLAISAAGLLVATLATAGSVTIVGGSNPGTCVYTSVSGDAGSITFNCGSSSATSAGTVSLATPTSIAAGQTVNGGATRSGGNNMAIDVQYDITGAGCTGASGTLSWTLNENGTKNVPITGATTGTCNVALTAGTGGATISGAPKTVAVVSADDPVAFDFDQPTIANTSFGAGGTVIKVKRTGGSNGDWALAMTYGGFLAASQTPSAGSLGASAGSTVATLQFPAGSTEASVTFTPVSSVPAGFPALPANGSVSITSATHSGTGSTVGNIPVGIAASRSFNLVAVSGCPVVSTVKIFAFAGQYSPVSNSLQPGQIGAYAMPSPMGTAGYVQIIQGPGTPVAADIEVWFSTCPGDVNDPLRSQLSPPNQFGPTNRKPCVQMYNYTGGPIYWNKTTGSTQNCKLPDLGGPYYVNYRHVKIGTTTNSCPATSCPMVGQFNVTTP